MQIHSHYGPCGIRGSIVQPYKDILFKRAAESKISLGRASLLSFSSETGQYLASACVLQKQNSLLRTHDCARFRWFIVHAAECEDPTIGVTTVLDAMWWLA